DGKTWTKYSGNPLMTAGPDGDADDLESAAVMKDGNVWRMWYTGHDNSGRFGIMYATAPAPEGPWTRVKNSFVFYPNKEVFPNEVWKEDGVYYLFYSDLTSICYATSTDGLSWTDKGVFLPPGPSGAWDAGGIYWSSLIQVKNEWYLFYNASAYDQGI